MAFGDTTQSASASGSATTTVAPTLSGGATAGNLLVFGVAVAADRTFTDPGGIWTAITEVNGAGNMDAKWYYAIAAGGETSVTGTVNTNTSLCAVLVEFEGPFAASPLDVSAEDESNISTTVTSQSTGTTGTTSQNDTLAVAFIGADTYSAVEASRAWSDSFTEVIVADAANGGRPGAFLAKKVLSATGTVTCTYSVTDVGDEMYGTIAVFKKAAAGGGATPHGPFGLALHGPLGRVFG